MLVNLIVFFFFCISLLGQMFLQSLLLINVLFSTNFIHLMHYALELSKIFMEADGVRKLDV